MASAKKNQKAPDTLIKIGRQGVTYQQKTFQPVKRTYGSTQTETEEYKEVIIDSSATEIIDQINARVKSPYYSIYWGIASLLLFFLHPLLTIPLGYITYRTYKADLRRKTTPLVYEFSDDYSARKFHGSVEAISRLAVAESSWRLKSKAAVNDWKRNAGSSSTIIRQ